MKVSTFLIKPDKYIGNPPSVYAPDKFTSIEVRTIVGLETPEGSVVVSKETWKRIELFIDILKEVDATLRNIYAVDALLDKWQEKLNEQKVQQAVAGTGEGEMACTESGTAWKVTETGLLPDVRGEAATGEAASPSL